MTLKTVQNIAMREAETFRPFYKWLSRFSIHLLQINSKSGKLQNTVNSTRDYSKKSGYVKTLKRSLEIKLTTVYRK